tara:strand:+ start:100 stop:450 length:351 start_codon:yes stop_codon:yes gene_type:complete
MTTQIDILQPILDIYDIKKDVLLFYLSPEIRSTVEDFEYLDDGHELFLNDKIYLISRATLQLVKSGTIHAIQNKYVTIKYKRYNNHLPISEYHIFIKRKRSKKNDRDFYKALLDSL